MLQLSQSNHQEGSEKHNKDWTSLKRNVPKIAKECLQMKRQPKTRGSAINDYATETKYCDRKFWFSREKKAKKKKGYCHSNVFKFRILYATEIIRISWKLVKIVD